jgi:hypothetical protein
MDINIIKEDQDQYIKNAKVYAEKIETLQTQFFSALDDFKKYYVYYNKNPEVNEYQNYYSNSKGQLQSISKDLFVLTNDIEKNIEELDQGMSSISKELNIEKKKNKRMNELLSNMENTQNGSEVLISDSKYNYNVQYYHNIEMFAGSIIIGVLLAKLFTNAQ